MAENIIMKQADGGIVLPKDDAILYDMIVGKSGIIYGCALTWKGSNQIHIDSGYGIIKGRMFEITEHTINAKLPTSSQGTGNGSVYINLELDNTEEPISIVSAFSTSTIPLTKDENANYENGVYQLEIGKYTATTTGIVSFSDTKPMVKGVVNFIKTLSDFGLLNQTGYVPDALFVKSLCLSFSNKKVYTTDWIEDTTYEDYPYITTILCSGVDTTYVPYVTFSVEDVLSGIYAPVAKASSGCVQIYASEKPTGTLTIPIIQCIRKV